MSLTKASSSTKLSFLVWAVFSLPFGSCLSLAFLSLCCDSLFIWKTDYSNIHFQISGGGGHLELLLVKGHLQLCPKKPRGYQHSIATSVLRGEAVEKVDRRAFTHQDRPLCRTRQRVNARLFKKQKAKSQLRVLVGRAAQLSECLPSVHEALSSVSSTT